MLYTAKRLSILVVAGLLLQACRDEAPPTGPDGAGLLAASLGSTEQPGRYIVLFTADAVPSDFSERVKRLGGSLEASLDPIGVAVVTGLAQSAAAELAAGADIRAVEPDLACALANDQGDTSVGFTEAASEASVAAGVTASPATAQFYARQWNLRAVFADEAWAAGRLGSREVVVAILDSGIDYLHQDLVGLVDLGRSVSLVPEDDVLIAERFPGRLPISDIRGHGTAAASIVASNAVVLAGVNRHVTLLAVKVFDRFGQATAGRLIAGIVYAAAQGADVISHSGTETFDMGRQPALVAAFERAVAYAFRGGALVVGVAGNDAADLDRNDDTIRMPCEAANAICASATGPTRAVTVNGPWEDVDAIEPYTGFGRSAISVAAPGGEVVMGQPGRGVWLPCTTTRTEFNVFPPCRAGQPLTQGRGTSWAAPLVAGLAALLVAELGKGNPALIRERILASSDDLGAPGVDPFYGRGRINVGRALGLSP